jgi:hypothetical protein
MYHMLLNLSLKRFIQEYVTDVKTTGTLNYTLHMELVEETEIRNTSTESKVVASAVDRHRIRLSI